MVKEGIWFQVAAQNCRKRKLDQIVHLAEEVKIIQYRKNELHNQQDHLSSERARIKHKFSLLYRHIFQVSNLVRLALIKLFKDKRKNTLILFTTGSLFDSFLGTTSIGCSIFLQSIIIIILSFAFGKLTYFFLIFISRRHCCTGWQRKICPFYNVFKPLTLEGRRNKHLYKDIYLKLLLTYYTKPFCQIWAPHALSTRKKTGTKVHKVVIE